MERMKILKYNLEPKGDFIRLVGIGCLHIGHKNCQKEKIKKFIDYVLKTPDTYALMLADTVENVISETASRQPGSMFDQTLGPEEQRQLAKDLIRPLADAGKILAWTEGNHSLRSWYQTGFSVERDIAKQLGVPFTGIDALLQLKVGNQKYIVHAIHGTGGGTTIQSVFGKLLAQSQRVSGADVYIRSHHHRKVLADIVSVDSKTGEFKKKIIGATGCFLGYLDSYAHRKEYMPTVPGCIKIKLYKNRFDIHGTL